MNSTLGSVVPLAMFIKYFRQDSGFDCCGSDPQGKALKMGQTLLTFIESSAFKARLEQAEVLKS